MAGNRWCCLRGRYGFYSIATEDGGYGKPADVWERLSFISIPNEKGSHVCAMTAGRALHSASCGALFMSHLFSHTHKHTHTHTRTHTHARTHAPKLFEYTKKNSIFESIELVSLTSVLDL